MCNGERGYLLCGAGCVKRAGKGEIMIVSKKRFEGVIFALDERVRTLEREVERLKHGSNIQVKTDKFNYFGERLYDEYPINNVIKLILDKMGVKLVRHQQYDSLEP